jgi:Flp pilus assembly protein TadG
MNIRSRARGEEGAAAVEFALIVGVLAMLIFGMLQFGLAFFQLQNLRAATREGARVGAVDGTAQDMRDRVQNASGLPSSAPLGSSVYLETRTGTGSPTPFAGAATDKPCDPATGTPPDSVIAGVNLKTAPAGIQNVFTVDIPLLPTIDLRSAVVEGEFRCEI